MKVMKVTADYRLALQGRARWLNHYVSIQNTAEITRRRKYRGQVAADGCGLVRLCELRNVEGHGFRLRRQRINTCGGAPVSAWASARGIGIGTIGSAAGGGIGAGCPGAGPRPGSTAAQPERRRSEDRGISPTLWQASCPRGVPA